MPDHDSHPVNTDASAGLPAHPGGVSRAPRLLERRAAEDETGARVTEYVLLLAPDAPLPAGAVDVRPKTLSLEPQHAGFALFHGLIAAFVFAVWHLSHAFGAWEALPLLLLAIVAAVFFVPPAASFDGTRPGRIVRVPELTGDVELPPLQRLGMWVEDRKAALAALAPGAWLLSGSLAGALPLPAAVAGAAVLLGVALRTVLRGRVDEIARTPAFQRWLGYVRTAAASAAVRIVAALGVAFVIAWDWWWFERLAKSYSAGSAVIVVLIAWGFRALEARGGEPLTLGDVAEWLPPLPSLPDLSRKQRIAAAVAGLVGIGVSLRIGEVADGLLWAGAVVLALASVGLVVLALTNALAGEPEPLPKRPKPVAAIASRPVDELAPQSAAPAPEGEPAG